MTKLVQLKIRLAVVVHHIADRYADDPEIQRLKRLHSEVEIGETHSLASVAAKTVRLAQVRKLRDRRQLPFKLIARKVGVSRQYAGQLYRKATA